MQGTSGSWVVLVAIIGIGEARASWHALDLSGGKLCTNSRPHCAMPVSDGMAEALVALTQAIILYVGVVQALLRTRG